MAGEAKKAYLAQVTVTSGAATLADAAVDAEAKTALTSANHSDYSLADFVLTCAFGTAPVAGEAVHLYRRDMNIDGVNDSPIPTVVYKQRYMGSFIVNAVTASQSYPLPSVPLSADCEFYIENDAGQTISAGWTLKATPWSYGSAA